MWNSFVVMVMLVLWQSAIYLFIVGSIVVKGFVKIPAPQMVEFFDFSTSMEKAEKTYDPQHLGGSLGGQWNLNQKNEILTRKDRYV